MRWLDEVCSTLMSFKRVSASFFGIGLVSARWSRLTPIFQIVVAAAFMLSVSYFFFRTISISPSTLIC